MATSLRKGFCISCSSAPTLDKKKAPPAGGMPSTLGWKNEFKGKRMVLGDVRHGRDGWPSGDYADLSVHAQPPSICIPRSMRWWEKGVAPNMVEIGSAQELVESLLSAGDRLVVVNFYSPGCGGCKALHPKICQFAETNPDAIFLKVNYEDQRSMCQSLNIHVLPFFRFYRGPEGRICSFSCTNATIKKFKDAMAKHEAERRNAAMVPAKGLEESELLKLASDGLLRFRYPRTSAQADDLYTSDLVGEELAAMRL